MIFPLKNNKGTVATGAKQETGRPEALRRPTEVVNVMSVDLEEWFQVTNFEGVLPRANWGEYHLRVPEILPKLLDLFARYDVRSTFFTLGWVAERYPQWIRRICEAGHEIASHGYDHRLVTSLTPKEFRQQLKKSKTILEDITGRAVSGFRAPSHSFCNSTRWVVDELIDAGFLYDSSIFPFGRRRQPKLCASRFPCVLKGKNGHVIEYPLSTVRLGKMNIPVAGGGFFRFFPYNVIYNGIKRINSLGRPAIMYFHPWEFDPRQPRVQQASWLSKYRHYLNLEGNFRKFTKLVSDFRFRSVDDVFWNSQSDQYDTRPQV